MSSFASALRSGRLSGRFRWCAAIAATTALLLAAVSTVSAQEPPDLDGSLGYDSLTTCWRMGGADYVSFLAPGRFGAGTDWAWPGCASPGSVTAGASCGPAAQSGGSLGLIDGLPLSGASPNSYFSIFPANIDSVLLASGAEAVSYVPSPSAADDNAFVYRSGFELVPPPNSARPPTVAVPVVTVAERNCFVDMDSPDLSSRLTDSCAGGAPVFHSRRDYVNALYGVIDGGFQTGYASVYDQRDPTSYNLSSPFSYAVPTANPTPVAATPWWSDADVWQRVPAREAAHFSVGWLHPDMPEGGLTVDYAYLLRQQHYMNAELLANLRSYSTDGHRVTRGVRARRTFGFSTASRPSGAAPVPPARFR